MKKIITALLIFCIAMSFVGCTDTDITNNTENVPEVSSEFKTEDGIQTGEALFLNWYKDKVLREGTAKQGERVKFYIKDYREWYNYAVETNALCAINITLVDYIGDVLPEDYPVRGEDEASNEFDTRRKQYHRDLLFKILEEENITLIRYSYAYREDGAKILSDYCYSVIIAITMEDLYNLVDKPEGALYNWEIRLSPQLRFDYEEALKELGWNGEDTSEAWIEKNRALLLRELGPSYIMQEVKIGEIIKDESAY